MVFMERGKVVEEKKREFQEGLVCGAPCGIPKVGKILQAILCLREAAKRGPEGLFYVPRERLLIPLLT